MKWSFVAWLAFISLCAINPSALATDDTTDNSKLTVDRIYHQNEFRTEGYAVRWLPDGEHYCRIEPSASHAGSSEVVRYHAATGKRDVWVSAFDLVPDDESSPLKLEGFDWSPDLARVLIFTNSQRVWRQNTRGDYWVLDRSSRQLTKLGPTAADSSLMFAEFSPDGRHVAYVRQRKLYVHDLIDGETRCLTPTDSKTIVNGTFDWVYEEELGLRKGFRWAPDGKSLAYWQLDTSGVRSIPLVNNTDSLYPKVTWIPYPKVGQTNSACRVGVVAVEGGPTQWMPVPGDPRNHYIAWMNWRGSSNQLAIQQLNRRQNHNRVWLWDVGQANARVVWEDQDSTWVDVNRKLFWQDGGDHFTWLSERDGWRQLYQIEVDSGTSRQLTKESFDVIDLLHAGGESGYFLASPEDASQRYLFRTEMQSGDTSRVTPASPGTHAYQISPNGRWAIHTVSQFDSPPQIDLVRLPEHQSVRILVDNAPLKKKLNTLARGQVEFLKIAIDENVELPAWRMTPPDFDPAQKYPLLLYVYGEPAGQTVNDRWGGSSYLWHLLMTQHGYVVMSIDNRGTKAPLGRAWRKSIYGKIGILPPADQAAAILTLTDQHTYLDGQRVGVWGWSGGGSMSLNAIFKHPDLYQTAVAIAPVPNQRYYDTIYQERYMGLPEDNVQGFLEGSPINFASGLEGNLLLIHGTGDDNCHYQTFELLINELIRHNKPFQMMAYPNRTHSIREGRNTTRHLRQLMTNYFLHHLPPQTKTP